VTGEELQRLRRLIRAAGDSARRLGDEPEEEPEGVGYFSPTGTKGLVEAIDSIARHEEQITMFVGAGVSAEAELPAWERLVRTLLAETQIAAGLTDEDRRLWIEATIAQGPLAAAAIARAQHADELAFRRALRAALYGDRAPSSYLPGALGGQIAELKRCLGPRLRLVTANYDGLLERALEEADLEPASYVRNQGEAEGKSAVWHLHGRLMRNPAGTKWVSEGRLVLTEGDYAESTNTRWPEDFVAHCLADSLCLFVGLSMTDPNFIRWLYRYADGERQHLAVFVRQASRAPNEAVRFSLERSAAARWKLAGVKPIWSNYYGEVAQFVHEIGLGTQSPAGTGFPERAAACLATAKAGLMPESQEGFLEAQDELSGWLESRVKDVRSIADRLGVELDGEDVGLGLWVADHATGVAELWGTSEQVWRDRRAIEARPMHVDSRWVGVLAILQGVAVEQDPAVYTTRWRFIRGIPILVRDPERCLVGSLTLTSATPLGDSALSANKAPPEFLEAIDRALSDAAAEFFTESK
jgi:SIR2-like domain